MVFVKPALRRLPLLRTTTIRRAAAYPLLLTAALLIAWSLFFLIYRLTMFEGMPRVEKSAISPLELIPATRPPPEEPKPPPQRPKPQADKPRIPSLPKSSPHIRPPVPAIDSTAPSGLTGILTGLPERGIGASATPVLRVSPIYPLAAARRGIEGWVRLVFAINAEGRVESPVVVASDPGSVFDRSALRAVTKWRYPPPLVNGRAHRREGVEVIIEYRLEQ